MPLRTLLKRSYNRYIPEAKTLFDNMSSVPSDSEKIIINRTMSLLKETGQLAKLDGLWMLCSHDSQASKLNWKTPGTYTLTEVNAPTFSANSGWDFNGTNQVLRTGLNPSVGGLNYGLNGNSFGAWSLEDLINTGSIMGCGNGGVYSHIAPRSAATAITARNNSSTFVGAVVANSLGLFSNVRVSATNYETWQNNTRLQNSVLNTVSVPTQDFSLGGINDSGTQAFFAPNKLALAYVGGGTVDVNVLYSIFHLHLVSKAVI